VRFGIYYIDSVHECGMSLHLFRSFFISLVFYNFPFVDPDHILLDFYLGTLLGESYIILSF